MIRVVSKKWYKDEGVYIGRPSPLGNPYPIKDSKFSPDDDAIGVYMAHVKVGLDEESLQLAMAKYVQTGILPIVGVDHSILLYRLWLRFKYKQGGPVRDELLRLAREYKDKGELTLVCWCKSEGGNEPCHGDVIARVVEYLASKL